MCRCTGSLRLVLLLWAVMRRITARQWRFLRCCATVQRDALLGRHFTAVPGHCSLCCCTKLLSSEVEEEGRGAELVLAKQKGQVAGL